MSGKVVRQWLGKPLAHLGLVCCDNVACILQFRRPDHVEALWRWPVTFSIARNVRLVSRTYLINVKRSERSISSGAKAQFFLAFDVGAKASTPKAPFMRWLLVNPLLYPQLPMIPSF